MIERAKEKVRRVQRSEYGRTGFLPAMNENEPVGSRELTGRPHLEDAGACSEKLA
jgi:hypothetical protein